MLHFGHVVHKDHEIIYIYDQESFMYFIGKHDVHYLLEHAGAVAHSKKHYDRLIGSDGSDDVMTGSHCRGVSYLIPLVNTRKSGLGPVIA